MSNLIALENISLAYGLEPLLDAVNLQVANNERVCLIGRNGAGKSSLLKIIDGTVLPDSGSIWRKPHLRLARLQQELPQNTELTVFEWVAEGLAETGKLLAEYHALTQSLHEKQFKRLEQLQHQLDAVNGWRFEQIIQTMLTKLSLDAEQKIAALSGGWQRRAALARALVVDPELLLLDEPTNHLDIEAIQWLEEQLLASNCGLVFITHDRALLQRLATRIIELDRGQLTSWPGDYANFLRHKAELLHAEERLNAEFDKKLAQEERWIRQGIKARRTRNEGRVRALESMRLQRSQRREVEGKAKFDLNTAAQSGQLVVNAENITHAFAASPVVKQFSLRIMRGDRIGLIGPNGVGKTTLLNILLGKLQPQSGTVILGTKLNIAYFDQLRQALDPEKTVIENVTEGSDFVEINGEKRHVIGYLNEFLFTPERSRTPVKALSGGECNRLLLAKLFSKPANLLVLDEPTNDLDIETLELLEELLAEFPGTLLIVSHDRAFLDNVVSSTLIFSGNGKIEEYIGGYQDWLRQRQASTLASTESVLRPAAQNAQRTSVKLSYKEQKELDELPAKIDKLEKAIQGCHDRMASSDFYKQDADAITKGMAELKVFETQLQQAFKRWEELEGKVKR